MHFLHLLALLACWILIGCAPTPTQVAIAPTNTLQGPVVPTRAPTLTATAVAPTTEPTSTSPGETAQANLPTDAPTNTVEPPTSTAVEPTSTFTTEPSATPSETPTNEPSPTTEPTSTATNTTAPTDTSTPTPTATPTNTNTPVPTDTPQPTTPPTATTAPTSTPQSGVLYTDSTAFLPVSLEAEIDAFSAVTGTLDDEHPARLYVYQGVEGEILNITMRSTDGSLDPSLLVIDPKGRELARNEDESADSYDAAVRGFHAPESGAYVIVATRYGQQFGFSSGEFELNVTKASSGTAPFGMFSQPIAYNSEVTGTINDDVPSLVYTFRGNSGDVISLQMIATSGDLDTRLYLTDNLGNILAVNDDDLFNLSIDSYIQNFILPTSGYFSIIATHYLGAPNSGDFSLSLTLEEAATPGETHPIYAVLNVENSRTLRADGQFFSNFSAGDSIDDDKNELRTESLLTFFLPPLPENTSLSSASLELAPCYETGSGFEALGPLTIYIDNYGSFIEARDFTRPGAGARILTEITECQTLDLTELAREAYNSDSEIQLRLTFRNASANDQGDEVLFTPRLLLHLSE